MAYSLFNPFKFLHVNAIFLHVFIQLTKRELTMGNHKEAVTDFKAEFVNVMGRIRRLRKYLKGMDSKSLKDMSERLNDIILEREIEEIEALEEKQKRQEHVTEVIKLMEEHGLSKDDLAEDPSTKQNADKKKTRTPKYLYIDEHNLSHRWNGKGKIPAVFRELIEQGVDIDKDCLAKNHPNNDD